MNEKIMIVDAGYHRSTKITTVDGTKMNAVKNYEVEVHSFSELAMRIYSRFNEDEFDKIIVDANGGGKAVVDQLIHVCDKDGYTFNPKTGTVIKKGITFLDNGDMMISGKVTVYNAIRDEDEF